MKKMIKKFGKLITASFIIMGVGIVTFPLVIPLYGFFGIDTDMLSLLIFLVGLIICLVGLIRRKKPSRLKFALLVTAISVLSIPILSLIVSLIYYLITGKPLGN